MVEVDRIEPEVKIEDVVFKNTQEKLVKKAISYLKSFSDVILDDSTIIVPQLNGNDDFNNFIADQYDGLEDLKNIIYVDFDETFPSSFIVDSNFLDLKGRARRKFLKKRFKSMKDAVALNAQLINKLSKQRIKVKRPEAGTIVAFPVSKTRYTVDKDGSYRRIKD